MNPKQFKTAAFMAFLKSLMMIFNLVFFLIGFSLLIIGFYGLKFFQQFFAFAPSVSIYYPLISIGLFMMLVAALSFWCTPKGIVWLLKIYAMVIFLLFLSIFSFSVFFSVKHDSIENTLQTSIERSMENYQNSSKAIDILQSKFKCCGSKNFTDWFATQWANQHKNVPKSCCKNKTQCVNQDLNILNSTDINQQVALFNF